MEERTLEQRIAALEDELANAKEEKAAKEKAAEDGKGFKLDRPWPRFDPTSRMGMPASAMRAMVEAVPDFRGIAAEQRAGLSQPGMLPEKIVGGEPKVRGSGWREPAKLESPPGLRWVDQQIDVADALDKQALERKLGKR
jgi:hypothetical protein